MSLTKTVLMSAVVATLLSPIDALGQREQVRNGFWFNVGLGGGSLGCEDCERSGGFSGALALGGTLSQHILLGASGNFWTKSEDDVTLNVGVFTGNVRWYPAASGGFFLNGGLGFGNANVLVGDPGAQLKVEESGFGALLGLGYDIRVGRNISLTPFINGYMINTENVGADVGQIGIGITIH